MAEARRRSPATALALGLLVFAIGCLVVVLVQKVIAPPADGPLAGRDLYLFTDSPAATALAAADSDEEAAAFERIAETPSAVWVEPEMHDADEVGDFVGAIARDAATRSEIAVFVVYGIPDRDCGNESRGGLEPAQYRLWVAAIAEAVADTGSVVILEPDSLALASQCGNLDERVEEITSAVESFSGSDTSVYLDGGHSSWLPAETMAQILVRAGIDEVRGFATNVSNYNSTEDEIEYADRVSALTGSSHYVIDVSRNGNGSNGQWCNPSGRKLGAAPTVGSGDSMLDATLWIKSPGESDGTCGGGPPAGQWWAESAVQLAAG